jgi:hypothetical protein
LHSRGKGGSDTASEVLNEYTIEYAEDLHMRDSVLLATRKVSLMRYIPETKKILVISEDADNILVMKEDFSVLSKGIRFAFEYFIS